MSRKKVTDFVIIILLFYVGVLVFLYLYQRNLMYFPDPESLTPSDVGVQGVQIMQVETDDLLTLEGWYFPPANPQKPTILWFHGNAGSHGYRSYKVQEYFSAGYGALLAGYRGYGGNPGMPGEQAFYSDARAYMRWLKEQGHENIILYGESIGTGVAVQMATEFDVQALILESPYSSAIDLAQSKYFFVPVRLLMKDKFESIEKIKAIEAPILIVHGERDSIIPIRFGQRLFDAADEPKTFRSIPEAGHNDLYEYGAPLHVLEFLSNISGNE